MKLKDWADKQGIAYLTAYRWFRDGKLPVKAYQTESGTIIVQDDTENSEKLMSSNNQQSNDIMSLFLKKTVEFSNNNSTVEDFAAYILTNFSLKLNAGPDAPKYSKVKPKSEDIQKHFQQFTKPKGEKPKPNMFMADGATLDKLFAESDQMNIRELADEIKNITGSKENSFELNDTLNAVPEMQDLIKDISASLASMPSSGITTYDNRVSSGGVVVRNVELTPQSINYTSSTNSAFGSSIPSFVTTNSVLNIAPDAPQSAFVLASGFHPSSKEIEQAHQSFAKMSDGIRSTMAAAKPKRGRKPSKKTGKK